MTPYAAHAGDHASSPATSTRRRLANLALRATYPYPKREPYPFFPLPFVLLELGRSRVEQCRRRRRTGQTPPAPLDSSQPKPLRLAPYLFQLFPSSAVLFPGRNRAAITGRH